jgi:hypothetical protein
MRIRDGKDSNPGSGMEKIRIRDPGWKKVGSEIRDQEKHGSATLPLRLLFLFVQYSSLVLIYLFFASSFLLCHFFLYSDNLPYCLCCIFPFPHSVNQAFSSLYLYPPLSVFSSSLWAGMYKSAFTGMGPPAEMESYLFVIVARDVGMKCTYKSHHNHCLNINKN